MGGARSQNLSYSDKPILRAPGYGRCLTRPDVLVEAEQIAGIVLVLQRDQPCILIWAIRSLDPPHALVDFPPQIVNVYSAGRPRLHRSPELLRPSSAFLRFGDLSAHT